MVLMRIGKIFGWIFFSLEFIKTKNVIIWRDLKFTLNKVEVLGGLKFTLIIDEVWVISTRQDILAMFFKHKIKEVGFVDAEPIKIVPTWKNNKKNEAGVSK